ncbi:uncharacterized protein MELLADRAFT_92500 [Melampsora larici-populina 98AG31]|uniref:Allergen n=1 Tax=Melampsora larici-populina (strain 98AG31 / pathotype 3-4-7) TaxID=747676 RepID=F4R8P4_MELLP|nr:uncharacterized protein MELLADRAFT_92500 [Melampsora larici-populina 98AG31]EGG11081.1 hypothetical protein MELLADRAFT_92500 [Melampsora larici-populina 98AG31]
MDKIKKALSPNKDETSTDSSSPTRSSSIKPARRSSKATAESKKSLDVRPTSEQVVEKDEVIRENVTGESKVTSVVPSIAVKPLAKDGLDAAETIQTQKVVAPVTHNLIKHQETEEVLRAREHDRHIHHVQHHVQPVKDLEVRDEVHHTTVAPTTVINENLSATADDAAAYESIGTQFKDQVVHAETKREVVDLGETVQVREHHHVHNVIQPVIEKETHDRHRIHTTVPVHHITHEAPIIHNSISHEPLSMDDYIKRGGSISSTTTHSDVGKQLLAQKPSEIEESKAIKTSPKTSTPTKVVDVVELETDLNQKLKSNHHVVLLVSSLT